METIMDEDNSMVTTSASSLAPSMAATTAIVRVTPICGARQESGSPPACYLLEVDSARILLDAGTTSTFDMSHFVLLKRLLGRASLDLVLLSHGDLAHCGGLPYLLAQLQVRCPVLATLPVHHLGLVSVYDAYQSQWQATGAAPTAFSLDDLDAAFERIIMLRYAQSYTLTAGGGGGSSGNQQSYSYEQSEGSSSTSALTVTPVAAGRTVGGALWRIRRHTEDIWYALGFNHRREAHLDGASLELVQRPSLLIADAGGALDVPIPRKQRDSSLYETLMTALRGGHSVLLPVDTASRSLELLQVIEQLWATHRPPYPVFFLSHQARRVLELAKGMLEWMSASLARVFETDRSNPWELKHVRPVHSVGDLERIAAGMNASSAATGGGGPRVILATLETLEAGWARVLLGQALEKAMMMQGTSGSGGSSKLPLLILITGTRKGPQADQDSGGMTVLTERLRAGLGCDHIEWAEQVPLEGEELRRFHREAQEAVERRAAEEAFAQLRAEQAEDEDDDDDENEGDEDRDRDRDDNENDRDEKGTGDKGRHEAGYKYDLESGHDGRRGQERERQGTLLSGEGEMGEERRPGGNSKTTGIISRRRADEEIKVSTRRLEREQIASAVALQHFYWPDYRHDWFILSNDDERTLGADPAAATATATTAVNIDGEGGRSAHGVLPSLPPPPMMNSPFYPLLPPDEAPFAEDGTPRRYQCFPVREPRRMVDDYGEIVDYASEFGGSTSLRGEAIVPRTPSTMGSSGPEPRGLQLLAPLSLDDVSVSNAGAGTGTGGGGGSGSKLMTPATAGANAAMPLATPLKWVRRSLVGCTLRIPCKFIDFVGCSDGRSLRTIYARIAPRRLLLVGGGGGEAADFLANHFVQARAAATTGMAGPEETWAPGVGETITVCSAVNVLPALLSESLIGALKVHALGEYEVAWIKGWLGREAGHPAQHQQALEGIDREIQEDAHMEIDGVPSKTQGQPSEGGEEEREEGEERERDEEGTRLSEHPSSKLLVITAAHASSSPMPSAKGVLLGDVRLSEVRRQVISDLRLPANFLPGGELIVGQGDRRLCIRKDPTQPASFLLEGPLCPEYYALRTLIYSTTAYLN